MKPAALPAASLTPLDGLIRRMIAQDGPIPVSRYMALALQHPAYGYYRQADPIGRSGDFITAPEVSQVFGELIGLWLASAWAQAGRPSPSILCEAGPGRGVLMTDALRAVRGAMPAFTDAAHLHLVESSAVLKDLQRTALASAAPVWCDDLSDVPAGPLFLVANEFLDALPVEQLVMTPDGWRRRVVVVGDTGKLAFAVGDEAASDLLSAGMRLPQDAPAGTVHETQPAGLKCVADLAERVTAHAGAALLIDYGSIERRDGRAGRSTFRGIRDHEVVDPLTGAGRTDLTVDVDFAAIAGVAEATGARVHGPVTQGPFLRALGVEARREALCRGATDDQRETVNSAIDRLVDPEAMGSIFKVMAIAHPALGLLPGFPE